MKTAINKIISQVSAMREMREQRRLDAAKRAAAADEHRDLGEWQQNNWKSFGEEVNGATGEKSLTVALFLAIGAAVLALVANAVIDYNNY